MEIQFKNSSGVISLSDHVFNANFNESLIHQAVVTFLAGSRSGTKSQKTRSEVSGGGAKPWKQKGSGRARAGTIRSPIWRGGGVTFAAKNRDFSKKLNKKMYRVAMRGIFSELNRQNRLIVVDEFKLDSNKTKDFVKYSKESGFGNNFLLVTDSDNANSNLFLASRNIPQVTILEGIDWINPVLLLRHEMVVLDKVSVEKINKWLS